MSQRVTARREFLKYLAASPYVASLGGVAAYLRKSSVAQTAQVGPPLMSSPAEALNVMEFEEVARRTVPQGHWAFVASGVDDDLTIRANREGYQHFELRPRRLRGIDKIDMRVNLFGTDCNAPIFTCPTGGERSFYTGGEIAVAKAAKARGAVQILSTATSNSVEDVNAALGRPVWYQLYAPRVWEQCERILRRVEAAGCTVVALTVDVEGGRNSETYLRDRPKDLRQCAECHTVKGQEIIVRERPMHQGLDAIKGETISLDWAYVDRIRKSWKGKFIIKGIDTRDDARLAVDHGVDGILVSNHGGRSSESLRATIESLPEVVGEVKGRVPVFVDGGIRRGTDIFKALALGAKSVGIGRPMLWGLGAFGQAGVDRVLEILQGELKLVMGNCGVKTLADITPDFVAMRNWRS
jgi:4-hydroxymandelate oxidase